MKNTWTKIKNFAIVLSCCIALLGIIMIIKPQVSALTVCMILGILYLGHGICNVVRYFQLGTAAIFFHFDLTIGILSIVAGALLLFHPNGALMFFPIAAGLYILISSIFNIQLALEKRKLGIRSWTVTMILAVINTIFGIFLFIDPFSGADALMMFAGITLLFSSIENLYSIYCIDKAIKHSRDDDYIDVEWKDL